MSNDDDAMAAVFAQKSALRKSMLKTLRGISEAQLASQCELPRRMLADTDSRCRRPDPARAAVLQ